VNTRWARVSQRLLAEKLGQLGNVDHEALTVPLVVDQDGAVEEEMPLVDGTADQGIEGNAHHPAPLRRARVRKLLARGDRVVLLQRRLPALRREVDSRFLPDGRRPRRGALHGRLRRGQLRDGALLDFHDFLAAGGAAESTAVERLDGVVSRRKDLPLRLRLVALLLVGTEGALGLRIPSSVQEGDRGTGSLLLVSGNGRFRGGARPRRPVGPRHPECLGSGLLDGRRRPVVTRRPRGPLVPGAKRAVNAPVGIDLEIPDHEVAIGRVGQR
jgi:hypothetical protein